MTARLVAGLVLAMALGLVGGCTAHEGQKLIGYEGKAEWKKAPDTGRYALKTPNGAHNVTYYVQKDERVGFRHGDTPDTIEAYAGDNAPVYLRRDHAKGSYWLFKKKASQ